MRDDEKAEEVVYETSEDVQIVQSFSDMKLKETLLRGIEFALSCKEVLNKFHKKVSSHMVSNDLLQCRHERSCQSSKVF